MTDNGPTKTSDRGLSMSDVFSYANTHDKKLDFLIAAVVEMGDDGVAQALAKKLELEGGTPAYSRVDENGNPLTGDDLNLAQNPGQDARVGLDGEPVGGEQDDDAGAAFDERSTGTNAYGEDITPADRVDEDGNSLANQPSGEGPATSPAES